MISFCSSFLILLKCFQFVLSDCRILTSQDLDTNQPLLLKPGTWNTYGNHPYHLPNVHGEIQLHPDDEIVLHCPGGGIIADDRVIDNGILRISCNNQRMFNILPFGNVLPFSSIKCLKPAQHSARRTGKTCANIHGELEIGFQLIDGIFITQITICFDSNRKNTLYTKFDLTSKIGGFQNNSPRPYFIEGGSFFNLGVAVEQCYYIPKQRNNINRQLHLPENSVQYIDKGTQVFTRGHLVAKADFVYGSQQSATFYFINAAPQAMNLNNKNWNELEISVRAFASSSGRDFVVYTGTHGLASINNIDLFLHCDNVNHIPVPQFFWKVVYDPETKAGVAFIGLNNPFEESMRPFCRDICHEIKWRITWERQNRDLGFSYCCNVNDFRMAGVILPQFSVNSLLN